MAAAGMGAGAGAGAPTPIALSATLVARYKGGDRNAAGSFACER